ncbi:MAG: hypothetical protein CHACPFDD_02495 [Phycisphaerae bacterium]|nr:hypothetical protein [Phycisphaerae bacterium]
MPLITIVSGDLLIALGVIAYVATGKQSLTALIPAVFGLLLNLLGIIALVKPATLKHTMHAAAAVGLLGFLGGAVMGLPKLPALLSGGEVARPAAVYSQCTMGAICGVFVALCVKSFIDVRRQRAAQELR